MFPFNLSKSKAKTIASKETADFLFKCQIKKLISFYPSVCDSSHITVRVGFKHLVLVLKSALSTFFEVLDGAFKHFTK